MNIRNAGISSWKLGVLAIAAGSLVAILGCGDGNRASVTGKVTANGAPVTGGTLGFSPVGGGAKPISVAVAADGSFDLSGDGVAIGKNSVTYMAPAGGDAMNLKPGESAPLSEWAGYTVKTSEIDVKSGSQTIDIELTK